MIIAADTSLIKSPLSSAFISFLEGAEKHGAQIFLLDNNYSPEDYPDCDLVLSMGIPNLRFKRRDSIDGNWSIYKRQEQIFKTQAERRSNVLVVENGFLKRRTPIEYRTYDESSQNNTVYHSLILNGLNNRGLFSRGDQPRDRWKKLNIDLEDWKTKGENIILCGQRNGDSSTQHISKSLGMEYNKIEIAIYNLIRNAIKESTSYRDVFFRPHPLSPINQDSYKDVVLSKNYKKPLEFDLENCALLCAMNSNASVEATIKGIPTLVMDEGAMSWDISHTEPDILHDKNTFKKQSRKKWANNLAYSQWNSSEMKSGEAFEYIRYLIKEEPCKLTFNKGIPKNETMAPWEYAFKQFLLD